MPKPSLRAKDSSPGLEEMICAQALKQFDLLFDRITRKAELPHVWEGMSEASHTMGKILKPGEVAKAEGYYWSGDNTKENRMIFVGTPVGCIVIFSREQGASAGTPSLAERTYILAQVPGPLYSLLGKQHSHFWTDDLQRLFPGKNPAEGNIGHALEDICEAYRRKTEGQ